MKEGLIRLTDEKDIFYDSIEHTYRYRQHCPNCGVLLPKCQCYSDLDELLGDIADNIADVCCSSKCCLLIGEWEELDEAMQEAGIESNLEDCLFKLTEEQVKETVNEYDLPSIVRELYEKDSNIPISHLRNPSYEEGLEIIKAMGDLKDILYNYDIDYYPKIKDLTELQASELLEILTADADFDYPHGDFCK